MKIIFILCWIILLSTGCSIEDNTNEESSASSIKPLIIGLNSWVGFGPFYIAQEKGLFKKYNLEVKLLLLEDTTEKHASFAAGHIDALATTADDVVVLGARGVKGKIVLTLDVSNGADGIVASANIKTLSDLSGHKIALQPGFVGHFFLLNLLASEGIDPKSMNILPSETGAAGAAFVAGQIDAAVTWEPWLSKASSREGAHVLATSADFPGIIVDVLFFRDEFLQKNSDVATKIRNAWFESIMFMNQNQQESFAIIAKALKIPQAEVADIMSGVKFFNSDEDIKYRQTQLPVVLKTGVQVWYKAGVITSEPNVQDLIERNLNE